MPKYKNVKEFTQPVRIGGHKYFVKPGDVISTPTELNLQFTPFLEKVSDDTPATIDKPVQSKTIKKTDSSEIQQLKAKLEELKKSIADIDVLKNENQTILKRLEVLKNAVETINQALKNVEQVVYTDEQIVIEDDEK